MSMPILSRPNVASPPGRGTRIASVVITPVAFRDPPLLNVWGVHEPWALRTIIQVVAEDGMTGLGEGYGDLSTIADLRASIEGMIGLDPLDLPGLRRVVLSACGATGSGASARTATLTRLDRAFGALEVACMDLAGKRAGMRVCDLLGGAARDRVPFSAYLFYKFPRHAGPDPGEGGHAADAWGPILTPEELARSARVMVERYGFGSLKLKGGVFAPEEEIAGLRALRDAFPGAPLRLDPNGGWTVETTLRHLPALDGLVEYLEDPVLGLEGMAEVQARTAIPLATNMCVVAFDHLPEAVRRDSVRIVLTDHHYWGGLRATRHLGRICETWGLGVSMHSNSHLGISLLAMAHAGAALPNLGYACDTHYPWLEGDVIAGGPVRFEGGCVALPDAPGLGVDLDPDRLAAMARDYETCGIRKRDDVTEMRKHIPDWPGICPRF